MCIECVECMHTQYRNVCYYCDAYVDDCSCKQKHNKLNTFMHMRRWFSIVLHRFCHFVVCLCVISVRWLFFFLIFLLSFTHRLASARVFEFARSIRKLAAVSILITLKVTKWNHLAFINDFHHRCNHKLRHTYRVIHKSSCNVNKWFNSYLSSFENCRINDQRIFFYKTFLSLFHSRLIVSFQ